VHGANKELLQKIEEDIGLLENFVFSFGKSTDVILGKTPDEWRLVFEAAGLSAKESKKGEASEADTLPPLTINIVVENPSTKHVQAVPVRYVLQDEVTADDVLDANGLDIGYDLQEEVYYLYKDGVNIEPGGTVTFNVVVKNKWLIEKEELRRLEAYTQSMIERTEDIPELATVKALAEQALEGIQALLEKAPPTGTPEQRIAGYREDKAILTDIREDLRRFESIMSETRIEQDGTGLRSVSSLKINLPFMSFKVNIPFSTNTLKLIIIIIAFLGGVSVLFLGVWLIQSQKDKRIQRMSVR